VPTIEEYDEIMRIPLKQIQEYTSTKEIVWGEENSQVNWFAG